MNISLLPTNLSNLTATAEYMNTATNDFFWSVVLMVFTIVVFIVLSRYSSIKALLTSAFMGAVLSMILFYATLVTEYVTFFYFGLWIIGVIASYFFE